MVTYSCSKCNKKFFYKNDYTRHINRKFPCNNDREIQMGGSQPNDAEVMPNEVELKQEHQLMCQCHYCLKVFSSISVLYRHMRLNCKVKKQHEKEKEEKYNELIQRIENNEKNTENNKKIFEEEINQLRNQLKEEKEKNNKLNQIIHKQTNKIENQNNIENQNVTINFNLEAFGREDMNKIDDKFIIEALKRGIASVPVFTERVHFNIKYPEFNNVYIPSTTHSHAMVFNGDKWELKDKNETIDNIYDNKYNFLEDKFEEICEDKNKEISESQKKSFERFMKIQDEAEADSNVKSKKIVKDIKKKMKYVLCNKKDIPIENYKKIENNSKK